MVSKTPQQIVELLKTRDELKDQPDRDALFQAILGMY